MRTCNFEQNLVLRCKHYLRLYMRKGKEGTGKRQATNEQIGRNFVVVPLVALDDLFLLI